MAKSSNTSKSELDGSDKDKSSSVLGGSDEYFSISVLSESDVVYSRTVLSGSVKETPCEPCQNEGNNTAAVRYCTDCSEYQCGSCSKQHMKFKVFRHHVVKDVEAVKPVINKGSTRIINKSTDQLAKLDINSKQVQQRPGHVTSSSEAIRNVTANLVSTIDTSTSSDNQSPHISDLTVVQTHCCVVTDGRNKSVKVVDTRTRGVTSQVRISDAEYVGSITSVNDDQVAVSVVIKRVSKILLYSVSASGIISDTHKSIDVKSHYNGITYSNDRFYAAIGNRIDVISMQGWIITTFRNESFSGLGGIALSNDHNTIYVCSNYDHKVFSVDLNGHVTGAYKDNDFNFPVGITVDSDGYVYVCTPGTCCVHQLTADLNKVQVIIKKVSVSICAFNKRDNSFIVGSGKNINVYSLTHH